VLAHLALGAGDAVARRGGGHQEAGDALLAGGLVGDGEDDGHVGVLAGGDELLDAVEHEVSPSRSARVVMAEASEPVWLGQAEAAELLAAGQGLSHSSFCASVPYLL
jgi:hypothetical protein